MADMWAEDFPKNVFIGPSCSTQDEADRDIPGALSIPGNIIVSLEPLLGPVDLSAWLGKNLLPSQHCLSNWVIDGLSGVIVGGETGPSARPMHPDWVRSLRDQCSAAGVPFFFKQYSQANFPKEACGNRHYSILDGRQHNDLPWREEKDNAEGKA